MDALVDALVGLDSGTITKRIVKWILLVLSFTPKVAYISLLQLHLANHATKMSVKVKSSPTNSNGS